MNEHVNDLECFELTNEPDDRINIYVCECWSNALFPMPDGPSHDTCSAYYANSFDEAKGYCENNTSFGGDTDTWHWRIHRVPMNYNVMTVVVADEEWWTLDRFGELPEEQWEADKTEDDLIAEMDDMLYELRVEFMERIDKMRDHFLTKENKE